MKYVRLFLVLAFTTACSYAQVGAQDTVRETVASLLDRLRTSMPAEDLVAMTPDEALALLTDDEKRVLGSEHLTFSVNVPVTVSVFRDVTQGEVPFWLNERAFQKVVGEVKVEDEIFEIWSRAFPAGHVGLGVNSIGGGGDHYFVAIAPTDAGTRVTVTDISPAQHSLGVMKIGEFVYAGSGDRIVALPPAYEGQTLLRGHAERRREAQITGVFQVTEYPATAEPDQILLTWGADPKTTQSIQWRTSTRVTTGRARYIEASRATQAGAEEWTVVVAVTDPLENEIIVNDPVCNRHTAVLADLAPGTTYAFAVSDPSEDGWTENGEFTTAPAETESFKFIYMGDAQTGLDTWGALLRDAYEKHPDAAFYVMAGDQVNRGNQRNEWDSFFHNARGVFDRRPLMPCLGNHEYQGDQGPWMYLELFDLPENGPKEIPPESGYSFSYGEVLFVVLDGNQPAADQAPWLESQLTNSDAQWKIAVFHQPVYSAAPRRDNPEMRDEWGPLFDKYHVDLVLQGHDHAYLRTYPMFNGSPVGSPAEGTIYVVSSSGTKMYELGAHDYTEVGMEKIATYQVLNLDVGKNTLTYRAYDIDGVVKDEFVIDK